VSATFLPAKTAIGQPDLVSGDLNTIVGPNTLDSPNGRVTSGSLYIPDSSNHRILGFNQIPTVPNANADFVIGQDGFNTKTSGLTSSALNNPADLWSQDSRLFLADFQNNRVLIWDSLPLGNTPADHVVGQGDFTSNSTGAGPQGLDGPASVAAASERLLVADFFNNRVLIWNTLPAANGAPADVVLGQPDFVSRLATLSASGLNRPRSVWSDGTRLVVSDGDNNRVLIWNAIPTQNGAPADLVVGQPDFTTQTQGGGAAGLNQPRGVFADGQSLYVADKGNNRVLIYTPFPTTNQPEASEVLGQGDFEHVAPNDDNQDGIEDTTPSARTLRGPTGVFVDGKTLFVTDNGNNRVLIFDLP
jgi:hypothetical protein